VPTRIKEAKGDHPDEPPYDSELFSLAHHSKELEKFLRIEYCVPKTTIYQRSPFAASLQGSPGVGLYQMPPGILISESLFFLGMTNMEILKWQPMQS
jgi:hypothetical protein